MLHRSYPLVDVALALGAGLAGATAMLVSQKIEMRATGREPSDTPTQAVETLTGIDVEGEDRRAGFSTAAHFAFGTALGLGIVLVDRVPEPARTPLFAVGAWGIGTGLLVALGIAEPPTRWKGAQLATDLGHHAVYGLATAAAFSAGKRMVAAD